ncbi:MAG: outer membrane lipid asymmetry maintenance protein MlaD [Alphaproteobacteria bacterium]|nr:outer membrane lipid asymmetry maintenance protein MlaD [Alphaproteobacteria bacterium]
MNHNIIETFVGAIVIIVAGFFLVFAYSSSHIDTNGYSLNAKFDRIDGLNVGSDVRISGVKVGTVTHQSIDPTTFLATITFTVDPTLKLPKDTSAEIVSAGLLGGKYLALIPGGTDEFLSEGNEIIYTQASVSLEAMIGQLIFSKKDDKDQTDRKVGTERKTSLKP